MLNSLYGGIVKNNLELIYTIVQIQNEINEREKIGGKTKDEIYQKLQRLGDRAEQRTRKKRCGNMLHR